MGGGCAFNPLKVKLFAGDLRTAQRLQSRNHILYRLDAWRFTLCGVSERSSYAGGAIMVASLPAPAYAGGMFDFGLTLPFVAITFLTMMAVPRRLPKHPLVLVGILMKPLLIREFGEP